ncbi:MAG TPA: MarR family transcriptional regulator [Steroidobacteraceae bacterium]|nr:MarR family transcriptional regulator [Steroidobacteraceae bacterium]
MPKSGSVNRTAELVEYWLQQRPQLDRELLSLELTVARICLLNMREAVEVTADHGITATDYSLMFVIRRGRKEGPVRPSDLGKLFNLQPSVVTYRVSQLVERGLVDRGTNAADRRASLLRVTRKGSAMIDSILTTLVVAWDERFKLAKVAADQRGELLRVLGAVAQSWQQLQKSPTGKRVRTRTVKRRARTSAKGS